MPDHEVFLYVGDSQNVVRRILSHCRGNIEASALRLTIAKARGYPIVREKRPSGSTRTRIDLPDARAAEHEISAFIQSCGWRYVVCSSYEEAYDFQWYAIAKLQPQLNKDWKTGVAKESPRYAELLRSLMGGQAILWTDLDRQQSGPGVYLLSRKGG